MTENSDPEREKQVPPGRCLWPGGDLQAAAQGMGARGAANPGRGVGDGAGRTPWGSEPGPGGRRWRMGAGGTTALECAG